MEKEKKEKERQTQTHDYVLLIMNCVKYEEKARYQKNTWLKQLPSYLPYYHVQGNMALESDFVFDNNERKLYVRTMDDYVSLPNKVIAAYEAVHKTFQYKYIFKTDDDQMLNNERFFDMLIGLIHKKTPTPHYGGQIVDVKQPYYSKYNRIHPELPDNLPILAIRYCAGRFYFLSEHAVRILITKKQRICEAYLEDYAVGLHLDMNNVTMMNVMVPMFFVDISEAT